MEEAVANRLLSKEETGHLREPGGKERRRNGKEPASSIRLAEPGVVILSEGMRFPRGGQEPLKGQSAHGLGMEMGLDHSACCHLRITVRAFGKSKPLQVG